MSTLTDLEKSKDKTSRSISLHDQIQNIPEAQKQEDMEAYAEGDYTSKTLQEKWLSEGHLSREYNNKTFRNAINALGFKQREYQSHGFLSEHPQHLILFDWEKNQEEGIFPEELTLGSNKKAFFRCSKNLHASEKREVKKHVDGQGCSQCALDALHKANSTPKLGESLAELMPEIAEQYIDWLNPRTATMVTPGVNDDCWWMPPCGKHNEYKMDLRERTQRPEDYCPYCQMASKYERFWYDLVKDFLNPLGIKVYANQHILEHNKDIEMLNPGIPQGPEIDIWIPYLNYGIEINTKRHHNKEKGTERCPLGYERNKSFRAMIQRVYLDHVWQVDHEANPEAEEQRILNSLRVAMHQKGMPIAVDWQYSGDWSDSK